MLPADWEEYVARLEREQKKPPPEAPRAPRRLRRMTSLRQRDAESQTRNSVKAIYSTDFRPTPTAKKGTKFTTDLGGNCEDPNYPHGKETRTRQLHV
jgi:hypothetical protein